MSAKKSSSAPKAAPKTAKAPNARYTDHDDGIIVDELKNQQRLGNQADSGWKGVVWTACLERLVKEGSNEGGPKTADKVQDRFTTLKKYFVQVRDVRAKSGFGWDENEKRVTATKEVWAELLATHEKYKRWQTNSFPHYDGMAILVDKVIATGEHAVRGGDDDSELAADSLESQQIENTEQSQVTDLDDDEGTEQSVSVSRKRQRAASETSITPQSSLSSITNVPGGRRNHNAGRATPNAKAVSAVATSIEGLTAALTDKDSSTPKRRKKAIRVLEEDGDLSENEGMDVLCLFAKDVAVMDTFLGLRTKERRTTFVRRMMEGAE